MDHKFIYAVIERDGQCPPIAEFPLGGIDGAAIETVCYRDIAAVVSSINIKRFDPDASGEDVYSRRKEILTSDLLKYQQVNLSLLQLASSSAVVPLKFGFTARDEQQVEDVLRGAYIVLRTLLSRLKGKVELVVQASWDLPKILHEIRDKCGLPDLANPQTGVRDPQSIVEIGRMLFEAAEGRRENFIRLIHDDLSSVSLSFCDGPRNTEAMILNRSYLVEKEREVLFDEAVELLGTDHENYLSFRYIGPLPAYSFANIQLNRGNFALVDRARKTMELPEKASWQQIRASYRKLVLAHHPDRNPGSSLAGQRCAEVVEAYEMLRSYCRSLPDFIEGGAAGQFSFAEEDVEKVFVLRNERNCYASP
ncbi:MAG: GvpL/GvpF family gas vesicle protein [Ignavibacteriales bacterium]|nr:GvpL/GvpF family gas vesicle protein [Ignavibacteriales bacterium]